MSSPAYSNTSARAAGPREVPPRDRPQSHRTRTILIVLGIVLLAAACAAAVFWERIWPFTEQAVIEDLKEASDSTVTVEKSRRTYFPFPGCVLEGVAFHHGRKDWTLITIKKITIEGSYSGILTKHVPRIRAEGGHVFIPQFGSNEPFNTQHSRLMVDEIVANGTLVEFYSKDSKKQPLTFDVHHGILHHVQWGKAIGYDLKFHNPEPPGEIVTRGNFGPWVEGNSGETAISGEYTFDHANLAVYGGVAGTLASTGKYGGVLKHIDIAGSTEIPDFEVTHAAHKVRLTTKFSAYVDAVHGNTFLQRVDADFGRTHVITHGSIASTGQSNGKTANLELLSPQGRIEDILGLFDSEPHAPMSGPTSIRAKVEIPPGPQPFLEKVKLTGAFGIDEGTFSKPKTQKDVNELSAGARGEKMQEAATVLSDLKGQVVLAGGISRFSELSFEIPGVKARMHGTYNLENHKVDLHGRMRVDTKIANTSTGFKSFLLKIIDPLLKKKKKGEVVPFHIGGTYEHPQYGLDLNQSKKPDHSP